MSERLAVYAGSFDPPTVGHVWMFERGLALFDRLIVAVGVNPDKQALFSLDERLAMLGETTQAHERARVESFRDRYLIDDARLKARHQAAP